MVVDFILPHAEFGPNDHRKDAPPFIQRYRYSIQWGFPKTILENGYFDPLRYVDDVSYVTLAQKLLWSTFIMFERVTLIEWIKVNFITAEFSNLPFTTTRYFWTFWWDLSLNSTPCCLNSATLTLAFSLLEL